MFDSHLAELVAWLAFLGGIVAWPLTAFTIFKDEPQGILGLSWAAVIYTGYQILQAAHMHRKLVKEAD
jgi:hypothetical protein